MTETITPRIFPERYWAEADKIGASAEVRQLFWPRLGDFTRINQGRPLPKCASDVVSTPYGSAICAAFDRGYTARSGSVQKIGDLVTQTMLYNWSLGRWEEEGHRLYSLDDTTALALLYTRYDDFPTTDFRLPVPAFYLLLPRSLGWMIDMPMRYRAVNPVTGGVSPPQPVEGVLVVGEYDDQDRLTALRLMVCCHAPPLHSDDTLYWGIVLTSFPTVGEVMRHALQESPTVNDRWWNNGETGGIPQEDLLTIVLGATLYIQSAHPTLHVRPPVPRPTVRKKGKHKREWKAFEESTRYTVTYVGHPDEAFRHTERKTTTANPTRMPPRPHLRAGHMHRYWHGTGNQRRLEPHWLPPVRVGTWDRRITYETIRELRLIERRTRPAMLEETPP